MRLLHSSYAKLVIDSLVRVSYSVEHRDDTARNTRDMTKLPHMTKDQVVDRLMHSDRDSLAESVYYSHKDFYGVKGHHMSSYTKEELVSWLLCHFDWNEEYQHWEKKVPFYGEDDEGCYWEHRMEEIEAEQHYYEQFG